VGAQRKKADDIQQRLIHFGARATRVAKMLPRTVEGRYISQQLIRSDSRGRQTMLKPEPPKAAPTLFTSFVSYSRNWTRLGHGWSKSWPMVCFPATKWPQLSRKIRNSAGSSRPPSRRLAAQGVQS